MSRPVKTYRSGNVEVAIFKNEQYNNFSFKFQKIYKSKEGQWKQTEYFTEADLANLSIIAGKLAQAAVKEPFKDKPQAPPAQTPTEQPRHFEDDLPPF